MGVIGFEIDQVIRVSGDGDEDISVPISAAYNHHYSGTLNNGRECAICRNVVLSPPSLSPFFLRFLLFLVSVGFTRWTVWSDRSLNARKAPLGRSTHRRARSEDWSRSGLRALSTGGAHAVRERSANLPRAGWRQRRRVSEDVSWVCPGVCADNREPDGDTDHTDANRHVAS